MARADSFADTSRSPRRRDPSRPLLRPRTRARRASYRRNPMVGIMKVLLPATAVALLLLVVAWPQLRPRDDSFRLQIAAVGPAGGDKPQVLNPRVLGVDDRSRPFQITANVGSRILGEHGQEVYELEQPKADMSTENGSWVAVMADQGLYDGESQLLYLEGNVSLFHDNGAEFVTSAATVNLDDQTATGDVPIAGQGPTGLIEAEGFRLLDRGNRILFTGRARMTIFGGGGSAP